MSKTTLLSATLLSCAALSFAGNPQSPAAENSVTMGGKVISVKYSAPSLRGRTMFGPTGKISKDSTWPVWRLGADSATAFHTDADLVINGLSVPKGDYTLFALVNVDPWQLIVNKQTGQWGLAYNAKMDLGRVPMTMMKSRAPIEKLKIKVMGVGKKGKIQVDWENTIAAVPFVVK
jgi:Protein of unknown function (DUF2911)